MRSRYTAFVVGDAEHLRRTWHPRTRPADVDPDPATVWIGLEVLVTEDGGPADLEGAVEFCAHWSEAGARGGLHERSRFARRGGRWVYVDGEIL
ncbi:YchJ family protein [Microbacterium hatanonis]